MQIECNGNNSNEAILWYSWSLKSVDTEIAWKVQAKASQSMRKLYPVALNILFCSSKYYSYPLQETLLFITATLYTSNTALMY